MFDYKLMTESAEEIALMEDAADFNYTLNILEISYMESGDGELFTEGVIESAKEYIIKIYNKIRTAVIETKAKISAKIADAKLKMTLKKLRSMSVSDLQRYGTDKEVNAVDLNKVKKALAEYEKAVVDFYKWVKNFDITEDNIDEFEKAVNKWEDKIDAIAKNMNETELMYVVRMKTLIKNNTAIADIIEDKCGDYVQLSYEKWKKESEAVIEDVSRQSKLTEGAKSIAKKTAAITKRAARTATYFITIHSLSLASISSFLNAADSAVSIKYDIEKKRPGSVAASHAASAVGSAIVGAGAWKASETLAKQYKNEQEQRRAEKTAQKR